MGWQQFVSSMTAHLAWQAALGVVLIVYRQQVGNFIGRVTRLQFPGGQVEAALSLEEQVKRLEQAAPAAVIVSAPPDPSGDPKPSSIEQRPRWWTPSSQPQIRISPLSNVKYWTEYVIQTSGGSTGWVFLRSTG